MSSDFPAAHSMDTEWFGVDADGCVAVFRSGENGAVPEGAPSDAEPTGPALFDAITTLIAARWALDRRFEPSLAVASRDSLYAGWSAAVARVRAAC